MPQRFPPLNRQEPVRKSARVLARALPQIALPWLEIGLAAMVLVLLYLR